MYKQVRAWMLCSILAAMGLLTGCKMEELVADESRKELTGTWQVKTATRNGTDITQKFDFAVFRIHFRQDGTFTMDNRIPFIVKKDGTYRLDDPQYPFLITFVEEGGDVPVVSDFEYPIAEGQRTLTLSFGVGCTHNTYRYTLEKKN